MNLKTRKVEQVDDAATGAAARAARQKVKRSLRSVARQLKVSPAYLSDLELGKRAWSAEKLSRFEKALRK
jgi:transcriptional regulator with XRE-family HTH domain